MDRREVVRVDEIEPMTFSSGESHASLIEPDGVGSSDLTVSQYILRAHSKNGGAVHPENDEAYYVLRGRARVLLGGSADDGHGGRWHVLEPENGRVHPCRDVPPSRERRRRGLCHPHLLPSIASTQ